MGKEIISRYWNGYSLKCHRKFEEGVYEKIRSDIIEGCLFPALRENEIHLYHEGGRAFSIGPRSVRTHHKYKDGAEEKDSLETLTLERYDAIKKGCSCYNAKPLKSGEWQEGRIVSRLFRRFSYWSKYAEPNEPKLVDVEVRFRRDGAESQRGSDKIDLLFLDGDGRLRFVEVKRQHDPRIWRREQPEVVGQIRRYECILRKGKERILRVYRHCVPKYWPKALELGVFAAPTDVCDRVPVLVCRKDAQEGGAKWLNEQLQYCQNDTIGSRLIVDGGSMEVGSYGQTAHPSWCADGRWESLSLKRVFHKIDELTR